MHPISLTKRQNLALALFALYNALDALTTWAGVSSGIQEGNPLPALLIASGGIPALILVKAAIALLALRWLRIWPRMVYAVNACSAILALAVASNLSLLVG